MAGECSVGAMEWHAKARAVAQRVGLQPRYLRRLRWISKARVVRRCGAPLSRNVAFVLLDPEPDNFTYELTNEEELIAWLAEVSGHDCAEVACAVGELRDDGELAARLREATAGTRWWWSKREPPFGKRVAWYALARLGRPKLIVETGVHDGLGSLALLRALERNAKEGSLGRLVSFDVNPAAGWIVGTHPLWELRIEPSRVGLPGVLAAAPALGLFIHDSLHTYENERFELRCAASSLDPGGVLVSDNAHGTRALAETCAELGLRYHEFHERPRGHFYPGGAMGAGSRASL
jgi:hypothetical protein